MHIEWDDECQAWMVVDGDTCWGWFTKYDDAEEQIGRMNDNLGYL